MDRSAIPDVSIHDDGTVTIAATFRWREPWAMDGCEVGALAGAVERVICERFADWEQLAALESVTTWDPTEERTIGLFIGHRPILFPSLEPELTSRDIELAQARRDLLACVHSATYAAHGGDFGSLPMLADAARGIRDALAVIEPGQEGDSPAFVEVSRQMVLDAAIRRTGRDWTVDSLNQAATTALRITRNWDNQRQEYVDA